MGTHYFSDSYEESRAVFRDFLDNVRAKWPQARLTSKMIGEENDNTIDMISAEALEENEKVIFLSCGEHGIEGYAGAASIQLFVEEFMDKIDPSDTGICLIHAINPWGMRHFRRVTENNIDLNRNYIYNRSSLPKDINKHYEKAEELFNPAGRIKDLNLEKTELYRQLTKGIFKEGYGGLQEAKKMGQYEFKKGVYYGGDAAEENTLFMKQIQQDMLDKYQRVVHMDWHTALGPAKEMTMVLPEKDERDTNQVKEQYDMKHVVRSSGEDIKGDSHHYFYQIQEDFPDTYLFSALFEFGTFGEGKKAELRELMTIVFENQLYWEGAVKEEDRRYILDEMIAMFYPQEQDWKDSVIKEARHGLQSILNAEGFL
ncbi:M14 family metallopeptidase [Virgibacillus xinjiangensis]|uniref:M14 family metallopeptidase n=1 Tax=Virgibacillus xinjiangensis TaxID=393090 RepID=A0ABV7CYD3_9BACI